MSIAHHVPDRPVGKVLKISKDDALRIAKIKSRGLGDTIAKITSAVGIKPCGGCKKRQAALNRMVPYKRAEASSGLVEAETRAGTRPPPPLP